MSRKKSEDSLDRAYGLVGEIDLVTQSHTIRNHAIIIIGIKKIHMGHRSVTQFKLRPRGLE